MMNSTYNFVATFKIEEGKYIEGFFNSAESFMEKYKKALKDGYIIDDSNKKIEPIQYGCFTTLKKINPEIPSKNIII